MFERPKSGERAILVNIEFGAAPDPEECQELRELALSAGADVLASVDVSRRSPEPRYLIGSGKVDELAERVARGARLVELCRDRLRDGHGRQ